MSLRICLSLSATSRSRVTVDEPLQIELANTGSVGTTHAEMTSASRYDKPGMSAQIKSPTLSHAHVMIGSRSIVSDSHSFRMYCFGRLTPVKSTCRPMTIRESCIVKSIKVSVSCPTHSNGLITLATSGPKRMPVTQDGTASADVS